METSFNLELIAKSDSEQDINLAKQKVIRRANEFSLIHKSDNKNDRKINLLCQELESGAFWQVLDLLDGVMYYNKSPLYANARSWTMSRFSHEEQQELLTIIINQALLVPLDCGSPAEYRGHSILLEDIAERTDSIFKTVIDEDFKKTLVNGAFWEELCFFPGNVDDLLEKYQTPSNIIYLDKNQKHVGTPYLDKNFANKGFRILDRYANKINTEDYIVEFRDNIRETNLIRYIEFVKEIDQSAKELDIEEKEIAKLVYPYIQAVPIIINDNYARIFKEELVQRYLEKYETIRNTLDKALVNDLSSLEDDEERALEIISCQRDPKETFTRVMLKMDQYELGRFGEHYKRSIDKYLDETTRPILTSAIVKYHQQNLRQFVSNNALGELMSIHS